MWPDLGLFAGWLFVVAGVAWWFIALVRHVRRRDRSTTVLRVTFYKQYDVEPFGFRMAMGLVLIIAGAVVMSRI